MNNPLIIDMDGLVYKAGFTAEKTIYHVYEGKQKIGTFEYHKDMVSHFADIWDKRNRTFINEEVRYEKEKILRSEKEAVIIADTIINSIQDRFGVPNPYMFLSGEENYRYDIYPAYKANRINLVKPVHYNAIRDYFIDRGAVVINGIEADDMCSIQAHDLLRYGYTPVISSADKDLLQVPGTHYNPDKDTIIEVDPYLADYNFYTQLLTGDNIDNICGLVGIGPVKAAKMLDPCNDERDMYTVTAQAYKDIHGSDWFEALSCNAQMLYLLKNYEDKWRPPCEF